MYEEEKNICDERFSGIGTKFYLFARDGGEPIEMTLKESTELKIEKRETIEPGEWKPEEYTQSFKLKCSKREYNKIKQIMLSTNRFDRQFLHLQSNPGHYRKIYRCMRYGDRVPRKLARRYPDFIRQMKLFFWTGCFAEKPQLIGAKC